MVSFGFGFFEVLILKRFVFVVSGIVSKVLKMLVFFFPSFGGFSGVACYCSSGFGRFRCFCVSCVLFFFVVLLLFLFCLLCYWFCFLFCFFILFFSLVVFCFSVCFVFLFCFFGGFKGQVRWPKGPPHLALNPPYFLVFVFCLLFFFCFFCLFFFGFCFFCFCFFGGFKGQVRWPKGPPHLALNPPYYYYLFFCFFFFFSFAFSLFAFK